LRLLFDKCFHQFNVRLNKVLHVRLVMAIPVKRAFGCVFPYLRSRNSQTHQERGASIPFMLLCIKRRCIKVKRRYIKVKWHCIKSHCVVWPYSQLNDELRDIKGLRQSRRGDFLMSYRWSFR
jgi:hypothetical protein